MTSERRHFFALVVLLSAVHAVLAAVVPVSGDEAYYWDCSRHLDWSYFDQPPLVIWTMIPFRALLGETALAVRAPALLASLLVALFLLPLVRRLGGSPRQAAGIWLLLHALPLFLIGSFYTSTDVAMVAAFVGATWAAVALAQGEERGWYGFGIAMGLGFLAKFPVVLALPALLPALVARGRDGRRFGALRSPHPWLAGVLAALLTSPVWIWAFAHDFDNLRFQLVERHGSGPFTLLFLGEFTAANLLLATPFLFAGMLIAGWRRWREGDPAWRSLLLAALSPLVFFALVAVRTRVGAHWGGAGLALGAVGLGLTAFRGRRTLIALGAATGLLLSAAAITIALVPEPLLGWEWSYRGRPRHISTRKLTALVGNERILAEVEARRRPGELVSSESYSLVHLLAFLSRGHLDTRLAHVGGGKHGLASLYWYSPEELLGKEMLFVTTERRFDGRLHALFASVSEEEPLLIESGGRLVRRIRFLRCRELREPVPAFSRLDPPVPVGGAGGAG